VVQLYSRRLLQQQKQKKKSKAAGGGGGGGGRGGGGSARKLPAEGHLHSGTTLTFFKDARFQPPTTTAARD
jgi:hypothetical protein